MYVFRMTTKETLCEARRFYFSLVFVDSSMVKLFTLLVERIFGFFFTFKKLRQFLSIFEMSSHKR